MTEVSELFPFSSLWGKWQQLVCFTSLLCELGKLWTLTLVLRTLKLYPQSPTCLLLMKQVWKWRGLRKSRTPSQSASQVSMEYVLCMIIIVQARIMIRFFLDWTFRQAENEELNTFPCNCVDLFWMSTKITFSLQVRVEFRTLNRSLKM